MNVLFTSSPGLGHVHPMVPLARALADRGHDVRWAVPDDVHPRLQAAGFATFSAGLDVATRSAEFSRLVASFSSLPPEERPDRLFPAYFGAVSPPAMLADLLGVVEVWPPALVVSDMSELAGPLAAAVRGIPHVAHGFGPLLPAHRVAAAATEVAPLWRAHGLEPAPYGGVFDLLYLDIYPPALRSGPYDHAPHVQSLRPVPFDAGGAGEDRAGPVVAGSRPLVYVTFGTVFNTGGPFPAAVAGAARLDVDVLVTVGPTGDPGALGPLPPNVRVERYVPQTALLPQCSVVASHAGSGTFLASIGLGIPQLCLPQAADQFINGARGAAAGAALTLGPAEMSADAVSGALHRLLHEPAFADRARQIGAEIAAMPSPDEVAMVLEGLPATWGQ